MHIKYSQVKTVLLYYYTVLLTLTGPMSRIRDKQKKRKKKRKKKKSNFRR